MPLPAPTVDLSAQGFEQIWQQLDLVDHHKPICLFIEIEVRFFQNLAIGGPLHVEIDRVTAFCDVLSKRRFADLPWPKQDNARLALQCVFNRFSMTSLDYTLHLFHMMEALQGKTKIHRPLESVAPTPLGAQGQR